MRPVLAILLVGLLVGGLAAPAGAQPVPPPVDEFVPIDQLPPGDQLPGAPLLVIAYSVVWVLAIGYLWSIWRRLSTVEREVADLARRVGEE